MYDVPLKYRILDVYLKHPFLYDLLLSIISSASIWFLTIKGYVNFESSEIIQSINTDLISVTISLAGFILASLTIIVTFKDSVDAKGKLIEDAETGKDLFFSSGSYFTSVKIFYQSAIILLLMFLLLSLSKLIKLDIDNLFYSLFSVICIVIITLTVLRSLYLLIMVIKLQTNRK
ncbi:MAG: hypothetical protein KFKLKKLM_00810 [Flavobacteriales bacterium]|nr:hypothetical protein [Flavobacteriales bacterium]